MNLNEIQVTDFTVDGKCSNCGQCCSNLLPMSEDEITRIKKYIRKHNIKERRHNAMVGYDMTCPFRDDANKKCTIYHIRPAICRNFKCNNTREDILNYKIDFHKRNRVVLMRNEFFGSKEDLELFLGGTE